MQGFGRGGATPADNNSVGDTLSGRHVTLDSLPQSDLVAATMSTRDLSILELLHMLNEKLCLERTRIRETGRSPSCRFSCLNGT